MTRIHVAPTDKVALDEISGDRQLIAARDILAKLGLIQFSNTSASITDDGKEVMESSYLIDESGELTDEGQKFAYDNEENKQMNNESLIRGSNRKLSTAEKYTVEEVMLISKVADGENDFDEIMENERLYYKLYDDYMSEMPYGVMKGRTGTPDDWIHDHFDRISSEIINGFNK